MTPLPVQVLRLRRYWAVRDALSSGAARDETETITGMQGEKKGSTSLSWIDR